MQQKREMEQNKLQKEHDKIIYTIVDIAECNNLQCSPSCWHLESNEPCDYILECQKIGILAENHTFSCIKVTVNVKNFGNDTNWSVGADDILLIDSEGYMYKGVILCYQMITFRISEENTHILPGTQVNYIQLFPKLPTGIKISKLMVNVHNKWFDFIYSNEKTSVDKIEDAYIRTTNDNDTEKSYIYEDFMFEINRIKEEIRSLQTTIFSCLNNDITTTERTRLENIINTKFYSIKLKLEEKEGKQFNDIYKKLLQIENDYTRKLQQKKYEEDQKRSAAKKLEDLLAMTPREFEEYIGQLYKNMGYEVKVTPYSNDKGVDAIMYKDGFKYVIQCKRYKGTVGSPDIQKFIGAMDHAKADKGIFITTGMFSFEAEKMACEHPLELINRINLSKLIIKELGKK